MTKCVNCSSTRSPQGARFCVDCGYAMRQSCAYEDCGGQAVPLDTVNMPTARCLVENGCRRYFRYCPNCRRLHRLEERNCRTPRCNGHFLLEPYAGFESAVGDETRGASVKVPAAWERAEVKCFDGHLTMPQALGGLAFRYGSLFFAGEDGFSSIVANRHRRARLDDRAVRENRVTLPSPPLTGASLLPHPYALRMAHGAAYLLSESGPLRVDLVSEEVQTAAQDMSARADVAANPFAEVASESEAPALDVSSMHWQMQAVTPNRWFGLGSEQGRLCLVQSTENHAFFGVSRVATPEQFRLGDVVDIMSHGEDVFLALRGQIWRLQADRWEMVWQAEADFSLRGMLQYGGNPLFWGTGNGEAAAYRFDERITQVVGQPLAFKARDLYERPVRLGTQLCFFDHTPNDHALVICDLQRPFATPRRITFVTNARVVWAAGAECDGRAWIVYALDDGTDVEFYVQTVAPEIENAWPLGSKLRVRRDIHGALAAIIADGHLAIAAATREGGGLFLIDMSGAST